MTSHKCPDCGTKHVKPRSLEERIAELERKVAILETKPPVYIPYVPYVPYVQPHPPYIYPWTITTGGTTSPNTSTVVYNGTTV